MILKGNKEKCKRITLHRSTKLMLNTYKVENVVTRHECLDSNDPELYKLYELKL